ncbi:uncharacterized protein LOC144475452 [Augochlora pura]
MWWMEILPSVAIMTAMVAIPQQAAYYVSQWVFGVPMRRRMETDYDLMMNLRDTNLNGRPWIRGGLEKIPNK